MGRRRKSAIGETCVNCKKVSEGEFCTERCLGIPKSGDLVTDAMIKYQVTHPIHPMPIVKMSREELLKIYPTRFINH